MVGTLNRFLLLEFCAGTSMCIANTFEKHPLDKIVTYRDLGVDPHQQITATTFAQLDLVLIEQKWKDKIIEIESNIEVPFLSQHFLFWCTIDVCIEKSQKNVHRPKQNVGVLSKPENAKHFANRMVELVSKQTENEDSTRGVTGGVDYFNNVFIEAVQKTSSEQLPKVAKQIRKPWISAEAYELIEKGSMPDNVKNGKMKKDLSRRLKTTG